MITITATILAVAAVAGFIYGIYGVAKEYIKWLIK